MKKILFAAFIVLASAQIHSCIGQRTINGSGRTSEKTIVLDSGYNELSVANGISVVLSPALTGSADIVADQAVMEYVSVTESNGRVRVCYSPNVQINTKIATIVTLPMSANLSLLEVSSAGKVNAEAAIVSPALKVICSSAGHVAARVESPDLRIEAGSAAGCNIEAFADVCRITATSAAKYKGKFDVRELHLDLSSSASCRAEGECGDLKINATSAGSFQGFGLNAARASVDASSGSSVQVFAAEELGLSISSGASVRYKGSPRFTRNEVSGGASLKNAN